MCLGRPILSQFVGTRLLVSLVFTLLGGVQVGTLNQLLALGNLCGGGGAPLNRRPRRVRRP